MTTLPAGFPANTAKRVPLDRLDDINSDEAFQYVQETRPFVARAKTWGTARWNRDYFKQVVGHAPFPLTRVEDGQQIESTVAELMDLIEDPLWRTRLRPAAGPGGGPLLILNRGAQAPDPMMKQLVSDFHLPRFITSDNYFAHVLFRNSSREPEGTYFHTPCHWEPNAVPTLFLQVEGRKHLWLFAPDQARYLGVTSELFEKLHLSAGTGAGNDPENYPELRDATCFEVVLEPGDIVYWPEFWYHWFVHYHAFQINLRFYWRPPRMFLNPLSATWAFSNAVIAALGGFGDGLEDAIASLSPEARELLEKVERQLIENSENLDQTVINTQRYRRMAVDPRAHGAKRGFNAT